MHIKETIVIIGTGKASRLAAGMLLTGNYKLLLCDKNFTQALASAQELNSIGNGCAAEAMECSFDCAWEADMILLAPAFDEQLEAARYIKDVVNQKILISLKVNANHNPNEENSSPDQRIEQLQQVLPNTKIAVVTLAATAGYAQPDANAIEHIAVYSGAKHTIDAVAELFENSGVPGIKKVLLSPGNNTFAAAAASIKC